MRPPFDAKVKLDGQIKHDKNNPGVEVKNEEEKSQNHTNA
jgi:uncharacterized alpha/beta hydrolase family protein